MNERRNAARSATFCDVWPNDNGPCGEPEVERLWFLNEWMDHPGHGEARVIARGLNPSDVAVIPGPGLGLGLCAAHLAEYCRDSLLEAVALAR